MALVPNQRQLVEGVAIASATFVVWKLLKLILVKSPLDNIPGPPPTSRLTGHLLEFENEKGWAFAHELSTKWGTVVRMGSLFNSPMLWVFDPKAMQSILIKDQYIYERLDMTKAMAKLLFGPGLLSTTGDHHKAQRKILNPVFSTKHMREMTPLFYRVSHNLRDGLRREVQTGAKDVNIMNWLGRTALELIGQGGLGYSFDPLVEDVPNPFGDAVKAIVPALESVLLIGPLVLYLTKLGSASFRRRVLELVPSARVKNIMSIVDTLHNKCEDIFNSKKVALKAGDAAVTHQVAEGKDIMSILLKANMETDENDKLPDEELLAQMSTLVFAGTDTTSSALSRILDLLSQNPSVQDKLRQEISEASNGEDMSYDQLVNLPYLDAVCRETMRLYPPANLMNRANTEDIMMPLSTPIRGKDGTAMHEIFVPKGTMIFVGITSSNRNAALWGEDALEWKPERWLEPLPEAVGEAHIPGVYSNLLSFSGGGRSCVGFKFSQLEMKVVLSLLVSSFKFAPADNHEDIKWNFNVVCFPSVNSYGGKPMMPIKIESVK